MRQPLSTLATVALVSREQFLFEFTPGLYAIGLASATDEGFLQILPFLLLV